MPPADLPDRILRQRQEIGRRVRDQREQAGLSQLALAHLADVSRQTVYRTELGTSAPSLDALLLIADALQVPVRDLMPPARD